MQTTFGTRAEEVIKTLALSGLVDMANSLKVVDARSGEVEKGVGALVLSMKDLSATAGVDSATGIQRLSRFIRRGEVALADGIIEIGNMNQAYTEYGLKIGKTVQQLSGEEKARVRMNIVMDEAKKSYGAYANIFQTSSKAFESIGNVVRTLTEILGNYLEPIFSVVANAFFQFFAGLRKALIDSKAGFQSWATVVAGKLIGIVRIIGILLSKIPYIGKYFESMATFSMKPIKDLADGVSGTEDAIGGATGATKKLKKELAGLAGFDEMNVLTQPDSGSGSGSSSGSVGGSSGGGGSDFAITDLSAGINAEADKAEKNIKKALKNIIKEVQPFVDSMKWLWENILKPFGKWIGENMGQILKWGAILAGIVVVVSAVTSAITWLTGVFTALGTVWGAVSTVAGWLTGAFTAISAFFAGGVFDTIALTLMYAWEGVAGLFTGIASAIGAVSAPVWIVIGAVVALIAIGVALWKNWDKIITGLSELWNTNFLWMREIFSNFFDGVKKIATSIKTSIIDPILNPIIEALKDVWENNIKGMIDSVVELGLAVWEFLKVFIGFAGKIYAVIAVVVSYFWKLYSEVWKKAIAPLISAFIDKLQPTFTTVGAVIGAVLRGIGDVVSSVFNAVMGVLKGIIKFLTGVFSGDWKKAWGGITDVFKSIWEGIVGVVKGVINTLIGIINGFFRGLNKVKLPEWTGLGNVGFNIKEIPKLASGGLVVKDTLAVLHKSSNEAVLPLNGNTAWIGELADKINSKQGADGTQLVVKIGENKIFDQFIEFLNDQQMATNTNLINV